MPGESFGSPGIVYISGGTIQIIFTVLFKTLILSFIRKKLVYLLTYKTIIAYSAARQNRLLVCYHYFYQLKNCSFIFIFLIFTTGCESFCTAPVLYTESNMPSRNKLIILIQPLCTNNNG